MTETIPPPEPAGELSPAEVMTGLKKFQPGPINIVNDHGGYHGCKAIIFQGKRPQDDMEAFFEENKGLLVVDVRFDLGSILCFYNKVVSDEEMAEFNLTQSAVQEVLAKRADERAEARRLLEEKLEKSNVEAAEALKIKDVEIKRLLEVGRKCEQHHASLIDIKRAEKKGKR